MVEYNGERTLDGLSKFLETGGVYGEAAPDDMEVGSRNSDGRHTRMMPDALAVLLSAPLNLTLPIL